jgi:hypothetical protein
MAYDEDLAHRIRAWFGNREGLTEKRMFGGLAFLLNGNMAVAASSGGGVMVRVPKDRADELEARPHAATVVMQQRRMTGWIEVDAGGTASDEALAEWLSIADDYARTLPPKR